MVSPRYKIAVVCSTLNQLGGPALHIRNLYKHINSEEFALTLIFCSAVEGELREFMLAGGVPAEAMVFIPHAQKRRLLPFIFELRRIFLKEKFTLVHAFETQTQVLAGLAACWSGISCFICQCEAQFLPSTISWPKRVLFRILNSFLKGYFSRSLTVSNGLAQELVSGNLRPAGRVEVLPPGISIPQGVPEREIPLWLSTWESPVIGTLSRLSSEKGLDRFIKAAALVAHEIPGARFVICGDGHELPVLQALVAKLSLDKRLEFRPWTRDVRSVLTGFDIFVMPSLREGVPITLLEAMSVGVPVIVSDIEGIRDAVTNGVEGLLVNTADTESFAMAIVSLCGTPDTAVKMGRRGAAKVRTHFSVEKEMARLRAIYREIAGHKIT